MSKINDIKLGLKFSFSYFSILPVNFKKDDDLSKKDILNNMLFLSFCRVYFRLNYPCNFKFNFKS